MRVGIVGAGICGLSAARQLKQNGHEAVLFEKSRGPGGRVATRRQDGFVWDTGATSIAPRGKSIHNVILEELDKTDLVTVEKPIYVHAGLRVTPGSRITERYVYRSGINTLAKLLAKDLDIRTETQIETIEKVGDGYRLLNEEFDALILTPPIPQTSALLWSLGESKPLANARYRPCLSIMLGFNSPLPPTHYHALLEPEQRHPLTWLSLESEKSPDRAGVGCAAMVAQMSPTFSLSYYEQPNEWLVENVLGYIERLFGKEFGSAQVSDVMRWKYSQPESLASFEHVNRPGSRLLIASDALLGGHIEDAFEVGKTVANMLT